MDEYEKICPKNPDLGFHLDFLILSFRMGIIAVDKIRD